MGVAMTRGRALLLGGLLIVCLTGAVADRVPAHPPLTLGGYRVLSADFHSHSSMWSDGSLTPWGLVLEARRQRLDVLAVTGHQELFDARLAKRFAGSARPLVLLGQEIVHPDHHVIAVGITRVVDASQPVAAQIADVHAQGGVTIAAHPLLRFSEGLDDAAAAALDGAEICHPLVLQLDGGQAELTRFRERAPLAAIGSSDFHATGRLGQCRTYVFARDDSEAAVLEAVRAHRTVVYTFDGRAYGDPALIALAESRPELRRRGSTDEPSTWLDWVNRAVGIVLLLFVARTYVARTGLRSASFP
jgi:predicted metal-dependent phosphoesterase TrpH